MTSLENRKFERYVITFPVEFSWKASPGMIINAQVINLSLGGLQVFVKSSIEEKYDKALITMHFPNKTDIMQAEGQVIYFKPAFEGVLIGFMFISMPSDKYRVLRSFIQSLGNS